MVKIEKGKEKIRGEVCRYISCTELHGATEEERHKVGQAIKDWLKEKK